MNDAANSRTYPKKAIVQSNAVYHSHRGEYFLGQTEPIIFGSPDNAWGALMNPADSNVNLFLNAYTLSNFSAQPLTAQGWLSSSLPVNSRVSVNVAAGNQSISPPPLPKIKILSAGSVKDAPTGGVYTFVRRVEPSQTLTKHDFQGMYIIPPGSSFALFFLPPERDIVQVRVAFGWWEEAICDC